MKQTRTVSLGAARRLAVARQRLSGPLPATPGPADVLDVTRDLGCLQLDPISVVARSHLLVLRSRLGNFDTAHLDALMWDERRLFEYWAHCASIVLTEDYPVHNVMMRRYAESVTPWAKEVNSWMGKNDALRDHILDEMRARGPLPSRAFEDKARDGWTSTGWTSGRNVSRMLGFLWLSGRIMVAGREGIQKLWDLSERVLPDWTPRDRLDYPQAVKRSAQAALRALGVARPQHIQQHFTRGRYPGLTQALHELENEGVVHRVEVAPGSEEGGDGKALPGPWYIHSEDLPLLERIEKGEWEPRTTLLSPFDNLICDRKRTVALFGFDFRMEIYVPKEQRKYGYYVLPLLVGDRLVGRVDPSMERKKRVLRVHAVHAEPGFERDEAAGREASKAIEELAAFLGARSIEYESARPERWKRALS